MAAAAVSAAAAEVFVASRSTSRMPPLIAAVPSVAGVMVMVRATGSRG
ncbi:MAG: hypothetical protein M3P31_03500 [Actinomycetota bacterium]|nr:hypothetical protein [Actinomycetota bacterium]